MGLLADWQIRQLVKIEPFAEELAPLLRDALALALFIVEPDDLFEQLVAALADHRPHLLVWDIVSVPMQHFDPGARMRVVAVEQRAVDVDQDGFQTGARRIHGWLSWTGLRG